MTSGFYSYAKLTKNATEYARRMNRLSCRIFGEVARPTTQTSMRVVKLLSERPKYKDPEYVDYYPRFKETYYLMIRLRALGLYRDEHQDFNDEMKRLRKLRGKGPPPKGQGKRAKK
ncbi:28S ribosomal protein S33, mitochondrial-like isoform X2 [Pollicipes pollicipes]|nr:28S ribosomal protein S33, mitochondrial-like isoform X2 [Pollicipes pollicipes]XP_037089953.1 28S ribosomal protein S33, mitochondrial-like isoform X2 [Pollicipes pollicipes]XP_037089954.1 28S ribosomal protein S33, mitochondrial-like isoform X2 [Pollicipes pollicipes]